jgi:hypothetical protein
LGSLRRWGDHRAHQQHLGHAIMPPIVRLTKQSSTRTSPMRPWRYNPSRTENRRCGFVLHDYAARRTGDDSRAAGLRSGRRTGCNRGLGRSGCDFALITHGEQRRASSRREPTVMTERVRRWLTVEMGLKKARNLFARSQPMVGENQSTADITNVL